MREFIRVMGGKTEQESTDALVNVRVTRQHFEDGMKRVKPSLDDHALETAERNSWELLYNQEERRTLEGAQAAISMATMKKVDPGVIKGLRDLLYARQKDFNEIRKRTAELEGHPASPPLVT